MQISKFKKKQKTIFALIMTALLMVAVDDGLCCLVTNTQGAKVQGKCQHLTAPKILGVGGAKMKDWECCRMDDPAACDRLDDIDSQECDNQSK